MIDIKLNRRLFAEEEFDDLERLMATYSLCQSKRSGKTFLIATKCKKNTWWYCVYAFIIPFCIGFIMLIPINKWICLLLGIAAASAFVGGLSVMHRNTLKKLQFHPLMVFDPQKRTISFYRFKDVAFFQMSGKVQKFNFDEIMKTQLLSSFKVFNPDGSDKSFRMRCFALSIFTRDDAGKPVQNMIFATCNGWAICKKIANLLKDHGNIPIDNQYGSGLDQYR